MKVLLLQKVAGLGSADEIKNVAEGYAHNCLFPRHLAVAASGEVIRDRELQNQKKAKDELRDLQRQQALVEKIEAQSLSIKAKVSSGNTLYAAITPATLSQALAKKSINIEKAQIIMTPIKETGDYVVKVKFRHGLEANLNITVSAQ